MHQTNKIVVFISLLAALCQPAFASAFYDGTAAYRAHNYQLAMMDFQKAIQEESGPKLAASYYRLGASYEKLKDYPNAVECFKSAQSIDGSLAFTSNHQKFLDRMDRDATIAAQSSSSSSNASFFSLEKTLLSSDVYIDPALTTLVSKENLAAAVSKTREAPVKIAVLDRLPGWYYHFAREHRYTGASSLGHYAKGVHTKLHMQKSGLVLICLHGMGAGICMVSDAMTASESKDIASRYAASIETGNYDRIGSMAADFSDAIAQKDHTKTLYISIAALVLIFAILGAMALLSRKRRSEIVQAREAIQGLKENIQSNIDYIDGYIPVLASGDPNKEKAIKFRQDAAALYEEAVRSIDNPKSVADLDQAHGLLVKAKKDVQIARDFLDKALGGSKNIPGDDALRPDDNLPPEPEIHSIPKEKRGVSFFSSQPARLDQLESVEIEIDGVKRKVLATPSEAAAIRNGQNLPVRSFTINDRRVPWYMCSQYDPYRDYWAYQNSAWDNLATGLVAGMILSDMGDYLFSRPAYGGSWLSPYAYSPGLDNWDGWNNDGGVFNTDVSHVADNRIDDSGIFDSSSDNSAQNDDLSPFDGSGSDTDNGAVGFFDGGQDSSGAFDSDGSSDAGSVGFDFDGGGFDGGGSFD